MELFKASKQWSERPADERFWGPQDAAKACHEYKDTSAQATVAYEDLRVEALDGDLMLRGKEGTPAQLSHYAFGQLCQRAGAPAEYMRGLPATLAGQNLNHGLSKRADTRGDRGKLLLHKRDNGYLARCFTGEGYQRIWNAEIFDRLCELEGQGWRTPPARPAVKDPRARPATEEDCGWCGKTGLSVRPGEMIAPAGCYASDRDMFAFMVHPDRSFHNPASPEVPLMRGFFLWNSEVGDASFGIQAFLLDAVCGNHICWNASQLKEMRVVHVGTARHRAFAELRGRLIEYSNASATDDQARVIRAQDFVLGDSKQDAIRRLLGLANAKAALKPITKSVAEEAYDIAERTPRYGNPMTAWALASGITELSQRRKHTADRVRLDDAAGALLEVAF